MPRAPKHYNDETPSAVLRFKKHPLLLSIMSSYVAEQSAHATQTLKQGLQGTPHETVVLAVWEKWSTEPLARRLGGIAPMGERAI